MLVPVFLIWYGIFAGTVLIRDFRWTFLAEIVQLHLN